MYLFVSFENASEIIFEKILLIKMYVCTSTKNSELDCTRILQPYV